MIMLPLYSTGKSMVAAGGCTFARTAIATPDHGAVAF